MSGSQYPEGCSGHLTADGNIKGRYNDGDKGASATCVGAAREDGERRHRASNTHVHGVLESSSLLTLLELTILPEENTVVINMTGPLEGWYVTWIMCHTRFMG